MQTTEAADTHNTEQLPYNHSTMTYLELTMTMQLAVHYIACVASLVMPFSQQGHMQRYIEQQYSIQQNHIRLQIQQQLLCRRKET